MLRIWMVSLAAMCLGGCFMSTARGGSDPGAVLEGCGDPLLLGPRGPAAPEVVFTGSDFVVLWTTTSRGDDPVRMHRVSADGTRVLATVDRPEPDSSFARLMARDGAVWRFMHEEGAVVRQTMGASLAVVASEPVGHGSQFMLATHDEGRVAVASRGLLWIEGGTSVERAVVSRGEMGWNGRDFLFGRVIGHGLHELLGMGGGGELVDPALALNYQGTFGQPQFASSAETGRHAFALPQERHLLTWEEGVDRTPQQRATEGYRTSVDLAWDGATYALVVADAPDDAPGELFQLDWDTGARTALTDSPADDRLPSIAVVGPGDIGIAWQRDNQVAFMRCR